MFFLFNLFSRDKKNAQFFRKTRIFSEKHMIFQKNTRLFRKTSIFKETTCFFCKEITESNRAENEKNLCFYKICVFFKKLRDF